MGRTIRVRGSGVVRVPAYGIADAEHLVEKELGRLWPEARVRILEVSREGPARLVEDFEVEYQIEGVVEASAEEAVQARREAFRHLRSLVQGTRYALTRWEERR